MIAAKLLCTTETGSFFFNACLDILIIYLQYYLENKKPNK